jgi:hypothetical protein
MRDIIREDARLIILRELHKEPNYSASDTRLQPVLEAFGIARSREWIREELRWLADMGAVSRVEVGTVMVATLLAKGVEHVERRLVIDGVKRPSPPQV